MGHSCRSRNSSGEPERALSYQDAITTFFTHIPVYPELVGVVGSRVPDYRGRFLRGLQSGHSVGQTVANSLKSHNHTQPTHTHSFSGQLVSTALSGTAAGQFFSASTSLSVSGSASGQMITSGGAGGQSFSYQGSTASSGGYFVLSQNVGHSMPSYYATKANGSAQGGGIYLRRTGDDGNVDTVYVPIGTSSSTPMAGTTSGGAIWGSTGGGSISGTANGTVAGTANASTVSGSLRNGNVSGAIGIGGGDPTDYTGSTETAPDHIYVRCLIRAKP